MKSLSFVSTVSVMVISKAIEHFFSSWNSHQISGRNGGIPNVLARSSNRVTLLRPTDVPTMIEAVVAYEQMKVDSLESLV